jgi:hypothetical protein
MDCVQIFHKPGWFSSQDIVSSWIHSPKCFMSMVRFTYAKIFEFESDVALCRETTFFPSLSLSMVSTYSIDQG